MVLLILGFMLAGVSGSGLHSCMGDPKPQALRGEHYTFQSCNPQTLNPKCQSLDQNR